MNRYVRNTTARFGRCWATLELIRSKLGALPFERCWIRKVISEGVKVGGGGGVKGRGESRNSWIKEVCSGSCMVGILGSGARMLKGLRL